MGCALRGGHYDEKREDVKYYFLFLGYISSKWSAPGMAALRQDSADPAFRRATHARQSLDPRHWSYPSPRPPRGSLRPAHFRRSRASGGGPWDQSSDRCGTRRSNQADTESRGVRTEFRGAGSIHAVQIGSPVACCTPTGGGRDRGVACDRQAPRLRGTPCELRETPCPLDYFLHPLPTPGVTMC